MVDSILVGIVVRRKASSRYAYEKLIHNERRINGSKTAFED
jgi:hypothetical protein